MHTCITCITCIHTIHYTIMIVVNVYKLFNTARWVDKKRTFVCRKPRLHGSKQLLRTEVGVLILFQRFIL